MYRDLRINVVKTKSLIEELVSDRKIVSIILIEGDTDHQREYVIFKLNEVEVDSVTIKED
jgi:hypothetical protein